jgi:hypothetical protein
MNEENTRLVWKIIQTHGDYLKDKLEPHPFHPKGRNPYAHICLLIKNSFQGSYRDIPDEKLNELVSFIKNIRD